MDAEGHRLGESLVGNPWRYANRRYDVETGFVAFGLRYYDPDLGRWISPDPAGFDDGPNLYAYVQNSPLNFYDEFGLFGTSDFLNIMTPPIVHLWPDSINLYFEQFLSADLSLEEHQERLDLRNKGLSGSNYYESASTYDLNKMSVINPETSSSLPFSRVQKSVCRRKWCG